MFEEKDKLDGEESLEMDLDVVDDLSVDEEEANG